MRNFILAVAILIGMLVASVFMAAAPSQAYAPPAQVTTTVVKHHRVVGLHEAHQVQRCTVTTYRLSGKVVTVCGRWRTLSYGVSGLGR